MELRPKVERERLRAWLINPLWSEIGYRFLLFGSSEIEYGVMRSLEPVSEMVLRIFCFFPYVNLVRVLLFGIF